MVLMPDHVQHSQQRSFAFTTAIVPSLVLLLDSLALVGVGYLTFHFLVYYSFETAGLYWTAIIFNWLVTVALMYFAGLYEMEPMFRPLKVVDRVIVATLTSFMLLLAATFSIKQAQDLSRLWGAVFLPASFLAVCTSRTIASFALHKLSGLESFNRKMVIVGGGAQLDAMLRFMENSKPRFFRLLGLFVDDSKAVAGRKTGYRVLGSVEDVAEFARANAVDDIVIALPWSQDTAIMSLIEKLRELPSNLHLGSDLIGFRVSLRRNDDLLDGLPLSQVMGKPLTGWDVIFKAIEDYVLGTLLLIILSPFLLLVALLVKLDSPGPVLFTQKRLGFNNQIFDIYKFRTMTYRPEEQGPTVQASRDDPRITRIGRILRRLSIDELPQLFNVLNGTMSIVGPRPHAIDHNEEYSQKIRGYFARHRVKPGITGLAQVMGYRGPTETVDKMEMRVKYDIEYTDNWSPMLDLKILLRTVAICISGKNAL